MNTWIKDANDGTILTARTRPSEPDYTITVPGSSGQN